MIAAIGMRMTMAVTRVIVMIMMMMLMMMFVSRCPGVVKVSIAWLLSASFCPSLLALPPCLPAWTLFCLALIGGAPIPPPFLSAY